jgi:vacuolar-type H+-ATPase subunit H
MKTKQQRKDEAWKKYEKIEQRAEKAFEEYQKKCAEIDNEEGETEETEIIHNGKKYRLVEE